MTLDPNFLAIVDQPHDLVVIQADGWLPEHTCFVRYFRDNMTLVLDRDGDNWSIGLYRNWAEHDGMEARLESTDLHKLLHLANVVAASLPKEYTAMELERMRHGTAFLEEQEKTRTKRLWVDCNGVYWQYSLPNGKVAILTSSRRINTWDLGLYDQFMDDEDNTPIAKTVVHGVLEQVLSQATRWATLHGIPQR